MDSKFLGLIVFFIMIYILVNEIINLTKFIVNFHNIKEITKISRSNCDTIYTEAETERFQISKNLYKLLLPNDVYNCKFYTVLILIYGIMFFVYIAYVFFSMIYDKDGGFEYKDVFLVIIILYILISIIMNIALRYVPWDEAGYLNYFYKGDKVADLTGKEGLNRDVYNGTLFTLLIVIIIVYGSVNQFILGKSIDLFTYIFYSLYFVFALYFLFNLINIVETFKINKIPHNVEQNDINWSADISYGSENYFYDIYLKYTDFSLFNDTENNNYSYKIHEIFRPRLKTFMLMIFYFAIIIFAVCFGILIYASVLDYKNFESYLNSVLQIIGVFSPIIFLFILLFYVLTNVKLNTTFNNDVLFNTNRLYKYDLNELNNVVTPYIAAFNNLVDQNTSEDGEKDVNYLYNIIILNVIISYFKNHISMFTNDSNQESITKSLRSYQDKTYINNLNKEFGKIAVTDINNIETFKKYYQDILNDVFSQYINDNDSFKSMPIHEINGIISEYKLLYQDMVPHGDINLVSLNSKSYLIPDECFDPEFLKRIPYNNLKNSKLIDMNYMEYELDNNEIIGYKIKCINTTNKKSYFYKIKNDLIVDIVLDNKNGYTDDLKSYFKVYIRNNIISNIYAMFDVFDIDKFNNKIELYNTISSDATSTRNKLLDDLLFKTNKDPLDDIKPHQFLLQKTYNLNLIKAETIQLFNVKHNDSIKPILDGFIDNMMLLNLYIIKFERMSDDMKKNKFFYDNIAPIFEAFITRQNKDEFKLSIFYLYCLLTSKFKLFVEAKDNYLQNVIENNFQKINNQSMKIISLNKQFLTQ